MKPIRLAFDAFGSYPGTHEIDFERLHSKGIFVVTGPTGTGKSTIFDAMVYALFGSLPGGRPASEVRSHHVDDTVVCRVEFEFESDGDRFRVIRTPAYRRPKRRGGGFTDEAASCNVWKLEHGEWVGLGSKVSEVDAVCTTAVGLTAEQFERVVLLPQGKFQQFLLADTKQRRTLLQALFGTQVYERAAFAIRARANAAHSEVQQDRAVIESNRAAAVAELADLRVALQVDASDDGIDDAVSVAELRSRLEALDPVISTQRADAEAARRRAESAMETATRTEQLAERWDRRDELRVELHDLDSGRDAIERRREAVVTSARLRPLADAMESLEVAMSNRGEAERRRDAARSNLAEVLGRLALPPTIGVDSSIAELTVELGRTRDAHDEVCESFDRLDELQLRATEHSEAFDQALAEGERARARTAELEQERDDLDRRLVAARDLAKDLVQLDGEVKELDSVLDALGTLSKIDAELSKAEVELEQAERDHLTIWNAFVAGNAPRLARELRDGEPCPVCGSEEHPVPATAGDSEIIEYVDVEDARRRMEDARTRRTELDGRRTVELSKLGDDASSDPDALRSRRGELVTRRSAAADASAMVDELEGGLRRAIEEIAAIALLANERADRIARARTEAENAAAELDTARSTIGTLERREVDARSRDLDLADLALSSLSEALDAVGKADGGLLVARTRADGLIADLGVDDPDAAIAEVLAVADEEAHGAAITDYDDHRARVVAALGEFADLPDDRPDPSEERALAEAAGATSRTLAERVTSVTTRVEHLQSLLAQIEDRSAANAEACERYQLLDAVAARCEGKGQSRIGLETWVLAGELDRVLAAANVHLRRMTSSRYSLERTDDAGHGGKQAGLDIAVRDVYTGRTRPPGSLSGGEQFQTSLSLALGLADVVSHGGIASGRRFDALFVDEGFGSLDPDALENAMRALEEIHEAGRMVGVITHVEAMKEVLPIGIRVERLPDGRGSTLTVCPDD